MKYIKYDSNSVSNSNIGKEEMSDTLSKPPLSCASPAKGVKRLTLPGKVTRQARITGAILFLAFMAQLLGTSVLAKTSPLAVVRSEVNEESYQSQHLGTFADHFHEFKRTLSASNVQFDQITDNDLIQGGEKLSKYKLLVIPFLVDLPAEAASSLARYRENGGKLIITDGGGRQSVVAQSVLSMCGVRVSGQSHFKDSGKLVWTDSPLPIKDPVAVGTMFAALEKNSESKVLAKWKSAEDKDLAAAVIRLGGVAFLGWAPGVQGDITANSRFLSLVLDELAPGITQEAATQISFAEYQTIKSELEYLDKRTIETINTAKQAEFAVSLEEIQFNYEQARKSVDEFHEAYKSRRFLEADEKLAKAREQFAIAFAQAMPVRPVEARSIWLDRGTIVATKNEEGMRKLFERIKSSGINVVYFETNNAGFAMYPSKLTEQNPEMLGWDPLGVAVREAKRHNMEIHAWLWIFAVGNLRHNPIIGKPAHYAGPVLNRYDFNWAMAAGNGSLIPPKQHEFWLDPSNPQCRKFVLDQIREISTTYAVDGIQLDYIRYPFNNRGSEMGFNWFSRMRFEQETGLSLDQLTDETREIFVAWKAHQVNQMVKEVSDMLRALKPELRISAAVYAFPRRMRLNAVQQEWETWVANGWIDTLNPMTYAETPSKLAVMADFCRESTADKALVYPGLSISRFDMAGLVEQLDTSRVTGTLGTTIFAMAHLDDNKLKVLQIGPYRRPTLLTPQSEPIRASRFLVDDFAAMVNRYLQDPRKHILSDTASTNDVVTQIEAVQKSMHGLEPRSSAGDIDAVSRDVEKLHKTVRDWLRLEAFIQRGFRAQYIANYLSQVEAILSYASHRASVRSGGNSGGNSSHAMAGNSNSLSKRTAVTD